MLGELRTPSKWCRDTVEEKLAEFDNAYNSLWEELKKNDDPTDSVSAYRIANVCESYHRFRQTVVELHRRYAENIEAYVRGMKF